jgi:methionyl-tRNA formyltransferase
VSEIDRVLFIGSKQLGLRVLQTMHSLSPDTLIGAMTIDDSQDTRTRFADFRTFAKENALPLHVAKNRKHSEQLIEQLKPDLCLVVGWYWMISKQAIDAVPAGFIGIHNSLLPKYRGGSPLIWQIIRGESEVGFSIFDFRPGMDDGPIWAQGRISVGEEEYIASILDRLEMKTLEIFQETYPRILIRSVEPFEQDHEQATYCAQRFPHDGRINWRAPAREVYDFIRAQSVPYPGAFTQFEGRELRIWRARLFDGTYIGAPGQIGKLADDGVFVVCGDDRAVILEDIELDGERGAATERIKSIQGRMS